MGYLDTKEHRDWRSRIILRDHVCLVGEDCKGLETAHHLIPKEIEEFRSDDNNGVLLCSRHHSKYGLQLSPHNDANFLFFLLLKQKRPEQFAWLEKQWNTLETH